MFITAIILAAGESKRFGEDKLSYIYRGKPLYTHVLNTIKNISKIKEIIFVTNSNSSIKMNSFIQRVTNSDYKQGMGTSLREGVKASSNETEIYLVCLADMPHVQKETIEALLEEYQNNEKGILIPRHKDQKGHPVLMSAKYKKEIISLDQDKGARDIIQAHLDDVGYLEVDDKGVLFDVDTKEDLEGV